MVPASRVKRRSAWVLVGFSTSSNSCPTTGERRINTAGSEIDV
jgi:hypothetical protein